MKYPRIWQHKKTKAKVRVTPWWERVVGDDPDEFLDQVLTKEFKTPCQFGLLMQVGYLIETEHGVWFGVSRKTKAHFKDLGEWSGSKKKGNERKKR